MNQKTTCKAHNLIDLTRNGGGAKFRIRGSEAGFAFAFHHSKGFFRSVGGKLAYVA